MLSSKMLLFFRNFRKSLLTSGQTQRYLLYAIGEILLVMIGILLALQVNNWNEDRKNAQWEVYYLNRLMDDIRKDTSEIRETLIHSYDRIMTGNTILTELEGDYLPILFETTQNRKDLLIEAQKSNTGDSTRFGTMLRKMTVFRSFDMHTNTYNEILSTGRFELIGSPQLREAISEYYGALSDYERTNRFLATSVQSYVGVLNDLNIPVFNNLSKEDLRALITDDTGFLTVLKNLIASHLGTRVIYRSYVASEAESLIFDIETYLNGDTPNG